MARTELPNGIILPAEYSDDWYDDMTSNLSKLDEVIGSDAEKLSAENVGAAALSNDYDDLDNKPSIPTKTSDLTNDSNFVDTSNSAVASGITSAKVTSYDSHIADTDIHVTTADKQKWNNGVSQAYVLRYSSTAITDNSTIAYSTLDNTDNIKTSDKIIDTDGKIFSIVSVDSDNSTVTVGSALIDLALDANVMHLSGNENVNGTKTFKGMIPINGDYLGNEASNNQRTNICLRSNRDTADKSCAYISRFRQNRSQGALQTGDLQMIGFDVLENEVRTSNVFSIQCSGWVDNVPTKIKLLSAGSDSTFGTSARPSKINDLNPGALSFPDVSSALDISGYITVVANANKESLYTPPANGWICVRLSRTSGALGVLLIQGDLAISGKNIEVESGVTTADATIPVIGGVQVSINSALADGVVSAKFYPCLGNV